MRHIPDCGDRFLIIITFIFEGGLDAARRAPGIHNYSRKPESPRVSRFRAFREEMRMSSFDLGVNKKEVNTISMRKEFRTMRRHKIA